jgi:hypothetical protein
MTHSVLADVDRGSRKLSGRHDDPRHRRIRRLNGRGKRFDLPVIDAIEFRGDKAVAHWGVMDNATKMEQLGVAGASTWRMSAIRVVIGSEVRAVGRLRYLSTVGAVVSPRLRSGGQRCGSFR